MRKPTNEILKAYEVCRVCYGKSVARGMIQVRCTRCGELTMINCLSKYHVCNKCRNGEECHMCGGYIHEEV